MFVEFPDQYDSHLNNKVNKNPSEKVSTNRKLSLESLMEELKLVVTEEKDFENRQKSKTRARFWILLYQESETGSKDNNLKHQNPSKHLKSSIETLIGENKHVVTEESKFWNLD